MRSASSLTFCLITAIAHAQLVEQGPEAPDVVVTFEQGLGFHFVLNNPITSNNYQENYVEAIVGADSMADPFWRFQGYVLFQYVDEATANGPDHLGSLMDIDHARPVLGVDEQDAITAMNDTYDPLGVDDCASKYWVLSNSGTSNELDAVFDPFTNAPYVEGQSYCFILLAFACAPGHVDSACASVDEVIWSRQSWQGAIQVHCVVADPFAGISTSETQPTFTLAYEANGEVRCSFSDARTHRVVLQDATGRAAVFATVGPRATLPTHGLADGVYLLHLLDVPGSAGQRLVVQH